MNKIIEFKLPENSSQKKVISDCLPQLSFDETTKLFISDAKLKNLSRETVTWYETRLKYLAEFLKEIKKESSLCSITPDDIKAFIVSLQNRKHKIFKDKCLSPFTIKGIVRTIKIFFTFLFEEEYIENNPTARIKIPRVPKKIIKPLSDENIKELFSTIDTKTFAGFRNYLMILIFLDTGVRVSELLGLKKKDISFSDCTLCVHGKGAKDRKVPYGATVTKALMKYLKWRGNMPPDEHIFVNRQGNKLARRRAEEIVTEYGKKAKIEGVRISPHTFRHTFALNWIRLGGEALSLQRVLGHESLEMVRNYVNLQSDDLVLKHRQFGLIDKLEIWQRRKIKKTEGDNEE